MDASISPSSDAGDVAWRTSDDVMKCTLEMVFLAHLQMAECADKVLAEHAMGRTHHRIMYFANRKPGVSVNELLELLPISNQAISRSISQLMKKGLVEQRYGRDDRRVREHYITEKGVALLEVLTSQQMDVLRSAHTEMDEPQIRGLWEALRTMIRPRDMKWLATVPKT